MMLDALKALVGEDMDVDPARGQQALHMATMYARAYTRGQGFTNGVPNDEIEAVIISVAARIMSNPRGVATVSEATGPFNQSITYSKWNGFNLLEQAVLNRYRVRAL